MTDGQLDPKPTPLPNGRGDLVVVADAEALAREAADRFARLTSEAVAERGTAAVALSGGSTPRRMGELLATAEYRDRVPWERLEVFWGDERWVPESDPESNAGVARRTFLDQTPIASRQIHTFATEGIEPELSAIAYGARLRTIIGPADPAAGVPRLDLVLLGMGDDGHTASLFPGTAALGEESDLVVANPVPKLDAVRLTFSAPLINNARQVIFLIGGAAKAETLAAVLGGPEQPTKLPSQMIRPTDGRLTWLVDRAAAAQLRR